MVAMPLGVRSKAQNHPTQIVGEQDGAPQGRVCGRKSASMPGMDALMWDY
jgi:predicted secreted protein